MNKFNRNPVITKAPTQYKNMDNFQVRNRVDNIATLENMKSEQSIVQEASEFKLLQEKEVMESMELTKMKSKISRATMPQRMNEYSYNVKRVVARTILENLYMKSLLVDSDVVKENEENVRGVIRDYDEEQPVIDRIAAAIKAKPVPLLKEIQDRCNEVAKEAVDAKMKEIDSDGIFDVDINIDDFRVEIESIEDDINTDAIAEIIKDKVKTVIIEEKEIDKKEEDIQKELEDSLIDDPEVVDEESLVEAYNKKNWREPVLKENTLFKSLTINAYKDVLKEYVNDLYPTDSTPQDPNLKLSKYDESKIIDPLINNDEQLDSIVNMDEVVADGIADYTLMEMLHTIRLESFNNQHVKTLIIAINNPR